MTTELFIASLTILTLAAVVIYALTADDRISRSEGPEQDMRKEKKRTKGRSDR